MFQKVPLQARINNKSEKYKIKSISKAFYILEMMASEKEEMGVSEIAEITGIGKGTTHRFLSTLRETKFVQQNPENKKYSLGIKAFEIGKAVQLEKLYRNIMMPHLRYLLNECGETVNAAILDYDEIVYIATLESKKFLRFYIQEGSRLPATCTALGKVLLCSLPDQVIQNMFPTKNSFKILTPNSIKNLDQLKKNLLEVKRKGFAYDKEEAILGVQCIAAPIFDNKGNIISAISISTPSIRLTKERRESLTKSLLKIARIISNEFAY